MSTLHRFFVWALISASCLGPALAQQSCSQLLFVSGYFSNNVAIFDACSGDFLRQLDLDDRIRGAQAVRYNPADDLIYVVSEGNDRILRYRRSADFEFVDVFAQFASNINPTGIDFGLDDQVYVASYGTSSVLELDPFSGQLVGTVLPPNSGLLGPDNGLLVSVLGLLYVPGYDSSSVARINADNGQTQVNFIATGSAGLSQARGIVDEGPTLLVSGEGSGSVYRFSAIDGRPIETLITGLVRPTGMAIGEDGSLLVLASSNRIFRFDRQSGTALGLFINASSGSIAGGTFLAMVPSPLAATVDAEQIGSQYWVFGSGQVNGRVLDAEMVSATGGVFGPDFDPAQVQRKRWGSIQMTFSACDRAQFSYDSTGPDSAGFGQLSYEVVRLVDSEATLICRAQGFDQVSGNGWIGGAWYGLMRSGEGLVVEVAADGTAVASFYTHRPAGQE